MSSKYFIYAGGNWRELETKRGSVAGLGRARFLYVRNGRLVYARRAAVLRALRKHAIGQRGAASDGPPLSRVECSPDNALQCSNKHCHSYQPPPPLQCQQCINDANFNSLRVHKESSAGVQCARTADVGVQCRGAGAGGTRAAPALSHRDEDSSDASRPPDKTLPERKSKRSARNNARSQSSGAESEASGEPTRSQSEECKELLIDEGIVEILRRFLKKNNFVHPVDLKRYDNDEAYRERFFYRINPLVSVERCATIVGMLRERRNQIRVPSLKNFMAGLGLRTREEGSAEKCKVSPLRVDNNKENITVQRRQRKRTATQVLQEVDVDSRNMVDKKSGTVEKPTKEAVKGGEAKATRRRAARGGRGGGGGGGGREYSSLEDQCIVQWLRGEGRARLVNGNRLWRALQPDHQRRTGILRSWHSLRNRYLRYILPALGALALPPREASRLRAAAAAGELKSQPPRATRPSILDVSPVLSASGVRARAPPRAPTPPATTPSDTRRPGAGAAGAAGGPTYSELRRRFARRRRGSDDSETSRSLSAPLEDRRKLSRASRSNRTDSASNKRHNQAEDQSSDQSAHQWEGRRVLRARRSGAPATPPPPPQAARPQRLRKLFNPQTVV